jgi:hypothetical protein
MIQDPLVASVTPLKYSSRMSLLLLLMHCNRSLELHRG